MKRLLVVLALLAMMVGLRLLGTESLGAVDPLTLAAIGFVILAAFAVAELLATIGLPKVTGYILSGIVLGPFVGGVLSSEVVEQMGMFKTLAVGLIALTAGLELETKALARLTKTLLATVGAKIVITAPLIGAALVGVELAFHPLGLGTTAEAMAVGLVFAALSLGTSPSIALAVVSESGAKGRLSELVLGAAVLKDLVVVVVLAICVAIAKALMGGGSVGVDVLIHVGEELGLSVVAGGIVGAMLIAYMRWIKAEMLLFVAAIVLVGAEFAEALHLELLLIFIVAGFTVRNFSDYGHELHHPLELVSLPVFVVFFTTAGADIDIDATLQVLPLALVLVVVRAGGFWLSARVGNRVGNEAAEVNDNAWYSYLPQAGVTLGLVDIAAGKLPEVQAPILTIGMAFVAVNLLGGPLALRVGLKRAGELPDEGEAAAPVEDEGEAARARDEAPPLVALDPLSPELDARLESLRELVAEELERGVSEVVTPWLALRRQAFAHLDASSVAQIAALAESPPHSDATLMANELAALFERAASHPQRLEITQRVPLEPRWLAPREGEGARERVRRALRSAAVKLGSRRAKTRELPMRLVAREAFEPRLATGILELFRASCRAEARLADVLRRRLEGGLAPELVAETLDAMLDRFAADARASVASALEAGSRRMHLVLARIDSPSMPITEIDFSEAAKGIERELGALLAEAEQWPQVIDSCWQTVEVSARIRRLDDRITDSRAGAVDLREAREAVDEELGAFARRLRALRDAIDEVETVDDEALDAISTHARGLLPKPASKRLRQLEQRLRKSSDGKAIHQALREAAARDTGAKVLVGPELVIAAPIPAEVRGRELDVRELIDGEIAGRVLPAAERELDAAAKLMSETQQAAAGMVNDVELLTEVYRRHESKDATLDNFRAGLERVQARCEQLQAETVVELSAAAQTVAAHFDGLGDRLAAALHDATGTGDPARWVSRRTDIARRQFGRTLSQLREGAAEVWAQASERFTTFAAVLTTDYRLRSGLSLPSAAAIAKLIEADNALRVSPDYVAMFDDRAIRDPRFFVAHRELLRVISRAERTWQQGRTANGVLVVGGPGSGKTSLLNVATLKLGTREMMWLPEERVGFIEALAGELHCAPTLDPIMRRLLDRPRVIVVDDLERRLPLGGRAVDELELLAQLIARTSATCFWIVAASRELHRLVARNWPLRVGFADVIELDRLDGETLAAVILARHRISHLELSFPLSPLRRAIAKLLGREPSGQQRRYFAGLAESCGSNLRAALIEWCRAGAVHGETLVLERGGRARALPFVRQLPSTALAILASVVRFGPSGRGALAELLLREDAELERWVHFLLTAELLVVDGRGRLSCPAHVRDVLAPELAELYVFHDQEGA
ncbi:glutathione-regulated potassium-efflux system protein KefB [Enhygromyxa salina]|uniref:Glutathione-regulated potassium-efflux system protein KefB n=1 Tax=Enhygromyxa salina TaxID=215803 RepID=A0A2S9XB14_9BACT|nr:cation:proton antiporter [Enhygromyxa salina]PRP90047.1 glutathione-regulated potassium-efflux system protein KefB [Enhygromyxa salina]